MATAGVRYPPQLLPEVVATLSSAQAALSTALPGAASSAVPEPQVLLLVPPLLTVKPITSKCVVPIRPVYLIQNQKGGTQDNLLSNKS